MSISSPGVGSGLDVNSIVTQLMAIEKRPLTKLDAKEATAQAKISAMGSLKGALSSLQSSLSALGEEDTFRTTKTQSSDESVFTASSSTSSVAANYSVTVNRLAQAHKIGSSEFSDTATFGGGVGDELTITVGSTSFTLDLSTAKTLQQIQSAINDALNTTGVTAGLITGNSGQQTLTLTSGSTGYDNRIQLSFGGAINASTFNFSMLNRDSNNALLASESDLDSSVTIDGVSVTRSSNSITDAVEGLTLNLKSQGSGEITISANPDQATNAVKSFVSSLNDVLNQIKSASSSGTGNSSVMRSIESQINSILNTKYAGLGSFSYLAEFGVTTKEGGGMLFSSTDMTSAIQDDLESAISFFTDTNSGFVTKMNGMLDAFLQSGGVIDGILDGAKDEVSSIARSRSQLEARLTTTEARLRSQYNSLDTLMSSMQTTSNYLTTQLSNLSSMITGQKSSS